VIVKTTAGNEAPLTDLGKKMRMAFDSNGPRRKNLPIDLEQGESNTTEVPADLNDLFDHSAPGAYTVQVYYKENQLGWCGRLFSNAVPFEVVRE
jgi:hypothetical protein